MGGRACIHNIFDSSMWEIFRLNLVITRCYWQRIMPYLMFGWKKLILRNILWEIFCLIAYFQKLFYFKKLYFFYNFYCQWPKVDTFKSIFFIKISKILNIYIESRSWNLISKTLKWLKSVSKNHTQMFDCFILLIRHVYSLLLLLKRLKNSNFISSKYSNRSKLNPPFFPHLATFQISTWDLFYSNVAK